MQYEEMRFIKFTVSDTASIMSGISTCPTSGEGPPGSVTLLQVEL